MHVIGTCTEMCPKKERQLREREGILHRFEWCKSSIDDKDYTESASNRRNISSSRIRRSLPKADVARTVKSFARSAAGMDKMVSEDLRSPPTLIRTVTFLCHEILPQKDESFNVIYDFVFDRLRSVRQDLVIQRICDKSAIFILETIIRFHVYSAFRLQDESVDKFDPHINRKHLVDCLKRLVCFYELNDYWEPSRNEFEILYLIVVPDSFDVLSRALSLQHDLNDPVFNSAIDACYAYHCRNYVRYFRLSEKFPPLIASYFTQHSRFMRSLAYQAMTMAYGVSNSQVPVTNIARSLGYPSVQEVIKDLSLFTEVVPEPENSRILYARFKKANKNLCQSKEHHLTCKLGGTQLQLLESDNIKYISSNLICPVT